MTLPPPDIHRYTSIYRVANTSLHKCPMILLGQTLQLINFVSDPVALFFTSNIVQNHCCLVIIFLTCLFLSKFFVKPPPKTKFHHYQFIKFTLLSVYQGAIFVWTYTHVSAQLCLHVITNVSLCHFYYINTDNYLLPVFYIYSPNTS